MTRIKTHRIVAAIFGLLLLASLPAQAHRGNWFQTSTGTNNNVDFFSPILFGWNAFPDRTVLHDSNNESSPLHVTVDNSDNNNTHVTFGTDSRSGANSQFDRYVYYPNSPSGQQWGIAYAANGGNSNWMSFANFQTQVRNNIATYTSRYSTAPVYYQRLIDDANEAIGTTTTSSVLSTWWTDFNTAVSSTTTSTFGPTPTPTGIVGIGTGIATLIFFGSFF